MHRHWPYICSKCGDGELLAPMKNRVPMEVGRGRGAVPGGSGEGIQLCSCTSSGWVGLEGHRLHVSTSPRHTASQSHLPIHTRHTHLHTSVFVFFLQNKVVVARAHTPDVTGPSWLLRTEGAKPPTAGVRRSGNFLKNHSVGSGVEHVFPSEVHVSPFLCASVPVVPSMK